MVSKPIGYDGPLSALPAPSVLAAPAVPLAAIADVPGAIGGGALVPIPMGVEDSVMIGGVIADHTILDQFADAGAFEFYGPGAFLCPHQLDMSLPQVHEYVAAGTLVMKEDEFGGLARYALADGRWEMRGSIVAGPAIWLTSLLVDWDNLPFAPKLRLVHHLLQTGWTPNNFLTKATSYAKNSEKEFWTSRKLTTPRSYFIALSKSQEIFEKFGDDFQIHHKMTDSYYLSLLRIQSQKAAMEFKLILELKGIQHITDADVQLFANAPGGQPEHVQEIEDRT